MISIIIVLLALAWAVGVPFFGGYIYAGGDVEGIVIALIPTVSRVIYGYLSEDQ